MSRLALIATVALALAACKAAGDPASDLCACAPSAASAAQVVDDTLLAFLSKARAAHHSADLAIASKDLPAAITSLDALATGPAPAAPETREVLADTLARLADLRSQLAEFEPADADITRGLSLVTEVSYFRGHLYEVRGLVEQRRAVALEAAGDSAGAERARAAALTAFQEAVVVQDRVIEGALGEPEPSGNPALAPAAE